MDTLISKIAQDRSESQWGFTGGCVSIKCVCVHVHTYVQRWTLGTWSICGIQAAQAPRARSLVSSVMSEPILSTQG